MYLIFTLLASVHKEREHCGQKLDVQERGLCTSGVIEEAGMGDRENTWTPHVYGSLEKRY